MKLRLSEEVYDYEAEINFKNTTLYMYGKWLTDGVMLLNTETNYCSSENAKGLDDSAYKNAIEPFISAENLKNVLKPANKVKFSDISYKGWTLAKTLKKNLLIDSFYANEVSCLEVFYYKDKYYFFELNEACPAMGIYYDSYMFIGLICGIKITSHPEKDKLDKLIVLDKYLESLCG